MAKPSVKPVELGSEPVDQRSSAVMTYKRYEGTRVSVIIPAFNSAGSIRKAIDSVLGQDVRNKELIVVDDGSTDHTGEIVAQYGTAVRYIHQQNRGAAAARNTGVTAATGEFVCFLDADDCWLPGFMEQCARFLAEHSEAVAVSTGLRFKRPRRPDLVGPRLILEHPEMTEPILLSNFYSFWAEQDHIRTGSVMMRTQTLVALGLQNAALVLAEDLELWGLLGTAGKWGFIPTPLWLCESDLTAAAPTWFMKYKSRWDPYQTVENWEHRIVKRLRKTDESSFARVRGRVANIYARAQILTGRSDQARNTILSYGKDMPANGLIHLLKASLPLGPTCWRLACGLIHLREFQKSISAHLRLPASPPPHNPTTA